MRVAAYARVSTVSGQMQHSLNAQTEYYKRLISENEEWQFAGIYSDNGISGTGIKKREGFYRLIKDCEEGKVDRILVKSVSRFARNTVDLLYIVRHLKKIKISFYF